MPRTTNFSLTAVPDLPKPTNPSTQSAWAYVVDALIDRPGQTYPGLAANRPQHLNVHTIEGVCYKMASMGILIREGVGKASLYRMALGGLEKIPDTWRQEGLPGAGQGERNGAAHSRGFAEVARLEPGQREPLAPLKGKPAELPDNIIKTPSGKFLVAKDPPPTPAKPPAAAIQAAEAKYTEACIILMVGEKPRSYPISVAKSLYRQLKDIFE